MKQITDSIAATWRGSLVGKIIVGCGGLVAACFASVFSAPL